MAALPLVVGLVAGQVRNFNLRPFDADREGQESDLPGAARSLDSWRDAEGPLARRPAFVEEPSAGPIIAASAREEIRDNCGPFGMPDLDRTFDQGPTDLIVRRGYVLEHSRVDKIARWVCESIEPEDLQGVAVRREPFAPDPLLAGEPRAELKDYKWSGFDRGHLAPAGDQVKSQDDKDATFFLSNMTPQVPKNNQQVWRQLEDLVRGWVESQAVPMEYVLTGGFFYDPAEEEPSTADGAVDYETIGSGVAVPTHYFKIVLAPDGHGGWRSVAFVVENRAYRQPFDFASYIRSIDWIEEHTGIDFFPDLSPAQKAVLEHQSGNLFAP